MKYNFIRTSDKKVSEILRDAGYPELNFDGKYYMFANIGNKTSFSLSELDNNKIIYTNKINI